VCMAEEKKDIPEQTDMRPSVWTTIRTLPFILRIIYQADGKSMVLLFATSILEGPVNAAGVFALKYLIDALTAADSQKAFFWITIIIAGVILRGAMSYVRELYSDLLRFNTDIALQRKNLAYILQLPYKTLEDPHFQELASTFDRRANVLLNIQNMLPWMVRNIFGLFGIMAAFVFLPWPVIVLVIISQVILFFLYRRSAEWSWSVLSFESKEGRRASYHQDVLARPVTLLPTKAIGLAGTFLKSWSGVVSHVLGLRIKEAKSGAVAVGLSQVVEVGSFSLGLWMTVSAVLSGATQVSVAAVFLTSFERFSDILSNLVGNMKWLLKEAAVIPRIKEYFSYAVEVDKGKTLPKGPLHIQFEDVWFRYPGTEEDIVKGLSFSFGEGDHIAFVGMNGAGKTTVLKLLMRVYEPTKGRILANGIDIKQIKPSAWRDVLAVLTQNTPTYDDTLEEQVHYGDATEPLNKKRFAAAVETSGLRDVAADFPRGFATHAGRRYAMPEDKSIELSGGQNQILAIARTLYRDARVYIFDEPTSAVDAEKEENFFAAIPEALQSKAVIYVSHRFSTLRRAERIIVFDQGRIIEDGTHEELIFKKGRYAELFTLQAKMYQ
jgi:ATP-binding cassette subfamily B protein